MSTSKLQSKFGDMLDARLPEFTIRENYKPQWLVSSDGARLELDFYIEELKVAFEVQGNQHFVYVEHFHKTYENFKIQKRRDEEKKDLCYGNKVKLIEIFTSTDAEIEIQKIEDSRKPEEKYHYSVEQKLSNTNRKKPRKESNSDEARLQRLEDCKKKLAAFERGEIKRDEFIVKAWRDVVENEGYAKSPTRLKKDSDETRLKGLEEYKQRTQGT